MLRIADRLVRDDDAVAAVEYALMLALIVLASLLSITGLGNRVGSTFQVVMTALTN
ncbi:Flp family type IVb pilin [Tautonia plasticadhaerens]|uniref:Flp/Fap pilin component n=1 Tax=Tautonia plasticadhaerens TaxID=2527974 RepID=A0A518HDH5_9BACT|nr:Flp family type IVb pilin [Tautonia plasticadhaerens]QDV38902.1 Flp/Fap pilin component [Tautonia plasticadhaerens]